MDNITDMLSTFFVSKKVQAKRKETKNTRVPNPKQLQRPVVETKPIQEPEDKVVEKVKAFKEAQTQVQEQEQEPEVEKPETKEKVRKYILKASEFHKKNIVIVNDDMNESIHTLSELLHKLSMMNNVDTIYTNKIHIISTQENKTNFKNMLIENPYLYFTDFDLQTSQNSVSKFVKMYESNLDPTKRHLLVVDYNTLEFDDDLLPLIKDNVHLFLLGDAYTNSLRKMYKDMGKNALLINTKPKLKMMQKQLFNKIVKDLCKDWESVPFEDFANFATDENLDVRSVIVKDGELRYN